MIDEEAKPYNKNNKDIFGWKNIALANVSRRFGPGPNMKAYCAPFASQLADQCAFTNCYMIVGYKMYNIIFLTKVF